MTVGELKKELKGIPDETPVYIADHDHAEWETNGPALSVFVFDQDEFIVAGVKLTGFLRISGKYLVIHG